MYKIASDKAQDGARRLKLADLAHGDQQLTDEERRGSLQARLRSLEAQIVALPKNNARRKALGLEKFAIQQQITAIRPARKCPGVQQHMLDVIRESVTKAQWRAWMAEAVARQGVGDAPPDPAFP